jgi:hypothetical protein
MYKGSHRQISIQRKSRNKKTIFRAKNRLICQNNKVKSKLEVKKLNINRNSHLRGILVTITLNRRNKYSIIQDTNKTTIYNRSTSTTTRIKKSMI